MRPKNLTPKILSALEATGLPFSFEPGGRHIKVKLAGRLVMIWPYNGGHERGDGHLKMIASIKRVARQVQA